MCRFSHKYELHLLLLILTIILDVQKREEQFVDYNELETKLGGQGASQKVAELIYNSIN